MSPGSDVSISGTARLAGGLYLAVALFAVLGSISVPSVLQLRKYAEAGPL